MLSGYEIWRQVRAKVTHQIAHTYWIWEERIEFQLQRAQNETSQHHHMIANSTKLLRYWPLISYTLHAILLSFDWLSSSQSVMTKASAAARGARLSISKTYTSASEGFLPINFIKVEVRCL